MFCRIPFGNLCCHRLGETQEVVWLPRIRKHWELMHTLQVSIEPGLQSQGQAQKGRVMLEYPLMMFQKDEAVLSFAEEYRWFADYISPFISDNLLFSGHFPSIYNRMVAVLSSSFFFDFLKNHFCVFINILVRSWGRICHLPF